MALDEINSLRVEMETLKGEIKLLRSSIENILKSPISASRITFNAWQVIAIITALGLLNFGSGAMTYYGLSNYEKKEMQIEQNRDTHKPTLHYGER